MAMQRHGWFGFLEIIGLYNVPSILVHFQGTGTAWNLLRLGSFMWFLYFMRIPAKPITDSGLKPVSQTGGAGHWSERSDAGVALWV